MTTAPREKKRRGWFKEEFGGPPRRTASYMVLPPLFFCLGIRFFPVLYGLVFGVTGPIRNSFGSFLGLL